MINSKNPVPKRLKEARIAAGLSQKSLGIMAGIDEFSASARMNQYEKGKHLPDFLTLLRIAEVLKLPTAFFYADNDNLAEGINLLSKLNKSRGRGKKVLLFLRQEVDQITREF